MSRITICVVVLHTEKTHDDFVFASGDVDRPELEMLRSAHALLCTARGIGVAMNANFREISRGTALFDCNTETFNKSLN